MSDRNPSKQRRAAQNKAARQALANRTTKASQGSRAATPTGSRRTNGVARTNASSGASAKQSGSGGRPSRTSGATVRRQPTNPISKFFADVQAVPGGKGMFFGFLFSIAAGILVLGTKVYPQEVMNWVGEAVTDAAKAGGFKVPVQSDKPLIAPDYAIAQVGPRAVVFALAPVVITTAGMFAALRENRRRNFTIVAMAMFLTVMLAGPLGIYFLFAFGGVGYAAFKARQAEPPPVRGARARSDDGDPDGDEAEDDDFEDDDGFDEADEAEDEYEEADADEDVDHKA